MAPQPSRIRILLADDHLVVRIGLRGLLETQPEMQVVAEAASGSAAVAAFHQHRPDLVLMDLRMPDLDGAAATLAIRSVQPNARILMLTTFDTDEDVFRAIEAGAAGFLLKNTSSDTLFQTIRTLHSGAYRLPKDVADRLALRRSLPELSAREREVLVLIAQGRSNKEIGAHLGVAENTVKNHVKVILEKLGVADRTGAATKAIQRGLVQL
ncbi:MAG: hypothetical protein RLZZ244_664 [Verrucomicrobiota bacterium]|jgi:two-component system NarL family response regulator